MTAVIGILNKSAAALAADSAVTVTGPRGPKIFNRANKIFQLSKTRPVGLMTYNHGEFMGTPWETIIKLYRSELGDNEFSTLEGYTIDFIKFLRDKCYFCDINNQKTLLYSFICNFLTLLGRSLLSENQKVVQEKPPDAGTILSAALNTKIELLLTAFRSNTEFCNDFSDFTFEEYENFGFTGLNNAITQVFVQNGVPVDVPTVLPLLKELIYLILKSKDSYNFYSGLVFSGYGEDEIFPQLIPINVSIALGKRLKYHPDTGRRATISHKIQSAIRPFAQTDVIDTILAGIDPAMNELYAKQFEEFIIKHNNSISQLIEPLNSSLAGNIKNIDANALASTLRKLIAQERKKYYIDPLMNAVTTLSKEDLAEMAESLIYLTYLKRRFTLAAESVGGPVDVAIITKCDGFIWIKRKHYFKAELNYHFFKNH